MQDRAATVLTSGMKKIADAVPEGALSKKTKACNRLAYNYTKNLVRSTDSTAYAAACIAIATATDPDYSAIKAPMLLIGGEEDALASPAVLKTLQEAIPNCKVEILPEVGHWHALEAPQQVADLIKGFL